MKQLFRQLLPGVRAVALFTILLGVAYPLLVTGVAQLVFPSQANGSVIEVGGRQASTHLAQRFEGPQWLQPRPSQARNSSDPDDPGWNGLYSGASNLGPNSSDLLAQVQQRRVEIAAANGVRPDQVPADALTASASGLDADISPAYAELQVNRIAAARGVPADTVRTAVLAGTRQRPLGFLGEPTVNVVEVNAALARG
ncbi:K(+)-transporting ATPase subunit C [Naumannella sp. ID2617S]|uniref:Potassium-transporting ATPase KdpC subunit n=1 Tax=Enemella dayhoffiae TaxID=2016507 RepID=A0A255GUW8_9ACTN|nr:K(+)-transporting ATPase subunit C [Enemella dayhoffiae]NNG20601.1 K(+)-transporting ATPase subunit C [Naumannella sp. ID2617S]OYO18586.1 K(+)-transporting ATPase subunit C [Enemella dayhoffiae]